MLLCVECCNVTKTANYTVTDSIHKRVTTVNTRNLAKSLADKRDFRVNKNGDNSVWTKIDPIIL